MSGLEEYEKILKDLGLIHLYMGDGKGKTMAAVGVAVRAKSWGLRVFFAQFLKDGISTELESLRQLGVKISRGQPSSKCVHEMDDEERHSVRLANCRRFAEVREMSGRREADLLILDGILEAISAGMVDEGIVVDFLKTKPPRLELVLTVRNLSPALIELSDYVSEFVTRKHSFETSKIMPRPGIEH